MLDKIEKTGMALIFVVVTGLITLVFLSIRATHNVCDREFPEVPTWECNFSSKYKVIKMRDNQVTDIPAGFERVEND